MERHPRCWGVRDVVDFAINRLKGCVFSIKNSASAVRRSRSDVFCGPPLGGKIKTFVLHSRAMPWAVLSTQKKTKSRFPSNALRHEISEMHLECCIIDEQENTQQNIWEHAVERTLLRDDVSFLDWAITLMERGGGGQKQTRIIQKAQSEWQPMGKLEITSREWSKWDGGRRCSDWKSEILRN